MINPKGVSFYDFAERSVQSAISLFDESRTVQSQAQDADINVIVRRFGVTGLMPMVPVPPTYGDFTGVSDYRTAMDVLNKARSSFMSLDADVRWRFHNDPAEFVDFCSDPANLPEMRKLGLAVPEKVVEPEKVMKVEVVVPPAKPAL